MKDHHVRGLESKVALVSTAVNFGVLNATALERVSIAFLLGRVAHSRRYSE
jgi:predicted outer membrane lipoprotein